MKNGVKILLINIAVMAIIFVVAEVGARVYYTLRSCQMGNCDGSLFTRLNLFHTNKLIGLSERSPVLGYIPKAGFNGIIHHPPGWENVYVSIDHNGFRHNVDENTVADHSGPKLLAVGDSFTFGDQVDNSETWPACVARKTEFHVLNGGVFGYGAAQAVLRAETEVPEHGPFNAIIWSITVGSDFSRDQLAVRADFPKPYVANVDGQGKIVPPADFDPSPDIMWLIGYSKVLHRFLLPIILEKGGFHYDGRYEMPGKDAAEIEEIIDLAFQRFARIKGTERKVVLLQYDPSLFWEQVLKERKERRKLIEKYGRKYNIPIIDSFDRIYFPERRDELWFNIKDYGHHTPYGNEVVCDIVIDWLGKNPSSK